MYWEILCCSEYVWIRGLKAGECQLRLVKNTLVSAIYTDFETSVVDGSEVEQVDGVLAPPIGDRLLLQFRRR